MIRGKVKTRISTIFLCCILIFCCIQYNFLKYSGCRLEKIIVFVQVFFHFLSIINIDISVTNGRIIISELKFSFGNFRDFLTESYVPLRQKGRYL